MQIIISPAKTLDFETAPVTDIFTQSEYLNKSLTLNAQLKKQKVADISKLMGLSENLATLNVARYKEWKLPFTTDTAKQAILAFKGDVYIGLNAETMSEADFEFAQQHLRILSGLYGILKPLDLIMPYRLEMGTRLATTKGTNLYHFWGDSLTLAMNNEAKSDAFSDEDNVIINLASNEYSKVLNRKKLNAQIITPIFKDQKNNHYKVISFFAKKARGLMSRYIIDNRITNAEDIKKFEIAGYYFCPEQSTQSDWIFQREEKHAGM